MENEFISELRERHIRYQVYWIVREFLQEIFKNRTLSDHFDVSEELEEIFDFQSADFARAFYKEFLKKVEDVKEIIEMAVSKKIGKIG